MKPIKPIKLLTSLCYIVLLLSTTIFFVAGFGRWTLHLVKDCMKDASEIIVMARNFKSAPAQVATVELRTVTGPLDFTTTSGDYDPDYDFSELYYEPDYSFVEFEYDPDFGFGEYEFDPDGVIVRRAHQDDDMLPRGSYRE